MNTKKSIGYSEPAEYLSKSIRKKHNLGEFAEDTDAKHAAEKKGKTVYFCGGIKPIIQPPTDPETPPKKISYAQAKKIALQSHPYLNACREYKAAYHFYNKNCNAAKEPVCDVVVLKDTGKIINFTTFIIDYRPEVKPKYKKF